MPDKDGTGPADKGRGKRKRQHFASKMQSQSTKATLVAISAETNHIDAPMDLRFGRCNYFLIFDPQSGSTDFIENPGKQASGGAGPMAAELLVNKGVGKVISGDFGPKAANALEAMNVEMVTLQTQGESLKSLINKINN
jgi:predicted Fe-Mo cluster-binding NifX family protein